MSLGLKEKNTFYVAKTKKCRGKKKFVLFSSVRTVDPFLLEDLALLINLPNI